LKKRLAKLYTHKQFFPLLDKISQRAQSKFTLCPSSFLPLPDKIKKVPIKLPPISIRFLLLSLIMAAGIIQAKGAYSFDANCRAAYKSAWALKGSEARGYLILEKKQYPDNLVPLYIANLASFVEIFSSEDKADFVRFKEDKDSRINALESDKKSPWPKYCKAEIYLQSAVLKLKFSDYAGAAYEFNKAYNNLTDCVTDFPAFLPAQKDMLLLKVMVGTVPENYRWMLKILGFSGDLKTSMAKYGIMLGEMEKSPDYSIFTNESRIIYAYLSFYMLNQPLEAWKQMELATADYATNPIDAFVRGNLALRIKKGGIAIETFAPHVKTNPPIPYLDYMMGVAKLQRGDNNAGFYFGRYIKEYKGEHYIKDAYLKLGWSFLMAGDTKHYQSAMELVSVYGTAQLEEDKNALKEATASKFTVAEVLRARLYFDGGYLEKALAEIKKVNPAGMASDIQKAEYFYREARIEDAMGNDMQALVDYQTVIDKYGGLNSYFAPSSCLYAGLIWEKKKNNSKAKAFFKQCIAYRGYIYKDSFDQKAYAGLKRVE
jgi:TolA-binding protein